MKYILILIILICLSCQSSNGYMHKEYAEGEIPAKCLVFDDYNCKEEYLFRFRSQVPNDTNYADRVHYLGGSIQDEIKISQIYEKCCVLAFVGKLTDKKYQALIGQAEEVISECKKRDNL